MTDRGAGLDALEGVFEEAHRLGFLGPGPIAEQIDHALAFAAALESEDVGPADFLDLGSGGGLPGLVLAAIWTECRAMLLDASERRTAFLRRGAIAQGWVPRVGVAVGRAENLARDPALRAGFPLVVARSFAAPSVTAEIGGAFVAPGGVLAVSEPRETADRWPAANLAELGLGPAIVRSASSGRGVDARVAVMRRVAPLGVEWPRGVGVPGKRPLWT